MYISEYYTRIINSIIMPAIKKISDLKQKETVYVLLTRYIVFGQ